MMHDRFDGLFSKINADPQFQRLRDSKLIFCFELKPGNKEGVLYVYPASGVQKTIKPIPELFDGRIWFVLDKLNASSSTGLDALATYFDDTHRDVGVDMSVLLHAWTIVDVPKIAGF